MTFDPELDRRLAEDIVFFRRRRAIFSALALVVVFSELTLSVALFLATLGDQLESAIVFSSAAALVVTFDIALAIRERAASHHASLNSLLGIRAQMRHPQTSLLWSEYHDVKSMSRINYIDALLDSCCGRDVVEEEVVVVENNRRA